MSKEELQEQVNYYKELSEVYLTQMEDYLQPSYDIMTAMGIVVQMNSELLEYLTKHKQSEKTKVQKDRLEMLMKIMHAFSSTADRNYQLKLIVEQVRRELIKAEHERDGYKQELNAIKQAWMQD